MSAENGTLDFATVWAPVERQEERRSRLENRLDENLSAADALLSGA